MSIQQETEVLVVGGGQAGVAMSEHLTRAGVPHLVLERGRIAERWRTGRWDSLVMNGPAWHDRFPGMEHLDADPDSFVPHERVAEYFEAYARKFDEPIVCGVEVTSVERDEGRPGFHVETTQGPVDARYVVAATGPFQVPSVPPIVPTNAPVHQMHSSDYRNPDELPAGGVLVVGSGSSGVQIADELHRSGRDVWLAVSDHERMPRTYRGLDYCWWLGVLGIWEDPTAPKGRDVQHPALAVSGAYGGHTIDFRELADSGIHLVGRVGGYEDGAVRFEPGLLETIERGDAGYLRLLDQADAFIERNGMDLPEEPEARAFGSMPADALDPVDQLDLAAAGVTTIIWATGFHVDYSWIHLDIFDEQGRPVHDHGVSAEPGVYFLGLPWLSGKGSSFIWGVWHDAKYIADQIMIQRNYVHYSDPAAHRATPGADASNTSTERVVSR